jgi:DNA-binding response OmpR family regulator
MIYDRNTQKKPLALVVDDDVSLRLTMGASLTKANFDVIEAKNGQMALALFKSQKPNLILLDVVMPEMNGFEVCMAIRNLPGGKYPQILMVTGNDDTKSTARAFEAGANDFIAKPINWVMLGHRARYMLRAGQAFRELYISKSRLTKTQALAKLGNWEIDLVSNEFFCSSEACSLLGLNPTDKPVTYNVFFEPIIVNEQEMVKQTISNAVKTKKDFSLNYQVMHSNISSPENSAMVAKRILKGIPKTHNFEGHDISVTTSIGISVFPTDGTTSETLLKNADSAMYHAKNRERNNYQFYMESLNQAEVERFSMERDLKKALERDEFVLYYQPQINHADRKIVGAEALIRWIHPPKGMIMPDKFIHIAEETDLIIDINK